MADKLFTYIFILIGLEFLFLFAGFNTTVGTILQTTGIIGNSTSANTFISEDTYASLLSTDFYNTFVAALALIAVAGIVASFFFRGSETSAVNTAVATLLIGFSADLINVGYYALKQYPGNPISYIICSIMFAFWVGMLMAVIEWWGGND